MVRNHERTVDKIGGSSMAWPQEAMRIVQDRHEATGRVVVVSAPGADTVTDRPARMTEMLKAYEKCPAPETLAAIRARLSQVAQRGFLGGDAIDGLLDSVESDIRQAELRGEPTDPLGETWMARAFAQMLGGRWHYLPAADLLHLDAAGAFDEARTVRAAHSHLDPSLNYVVDGNQGRSPSGRTVRIGNGGSDVSAAYIRRALGPGVMRLHSDVDGYKTVDPNLRTDGDITRIAQNVPFVTYHEAEQLGKAGNGLVHRAVPRVLRGSGSQTDLHATKSGLSGTSLVDTRPNVIDQPIVGITGEKEVVKVTWQRPDSENEFGATIPFLQDLKAARIPLHSVTTDDDSQSIYTGGAHRADIERTFLTSREVAIKEDMSSVSIVGEGLLAVNDPYSRAQTLAKALGALAQYRIPLDSMTSDGTSATLFVPRRYYVDAVDAVHAQVIGGR